MTVTDDDPMICQKCGVTHTRCTAHNREGKACGQWPMEDRKVCRMHGGLIPSVVAAAARRKQERVAQAALETFGVPKDVGPHEALMQELHRTAGAVEWLGAVVAELEKADVTWGMTEETNVGAGQFPGTDSKYGSEVNTWVKLWQSERAHLVRVSKECISAGIEERKVRLAEAAGEQLARLIRTIVDSLELTGDQRAIAARVVPDQLRRFSAAS